MTHFAGFDWAKDHHDIVVVDAQGRIVSEFRIEHSLTGWRQWKEKTAAFPHLGVVIETSFGAAVEQLLDSGVTVFPVNPRNAKRYRERKCSSGDKTDRQDAWSLADALRLDGHGWRALTVQDPVVAELRILCRDEVALIGERTALVNQLQQALHEYYPTALEAFNDWTSIGAGSFVTCGTVGARGTYEDSCRLNGLHAQRAPLAVSNVAMEESPSYRLPC